MRQKLNLIISGLAGAILIWVSYRTSLGYSQYLPQPLRGWLSQANFQLQTAVANLADGFYLPIYWQGREAKKIKNFNLTLSSADIIQLASDARESVKRGYNVKQAASNQKITLQFAGNQYPASISFHGGGANDFVFNKNDYNVKIDNGQNVADYPGFNLFNPSVHQWLVPLLAGRVASRLNLYVNDQFPVAIKINNKTSGVYLLEEKINEDFLAKRGLDKAQVIKLRDETRLPHRVNTMALDAHILSGWDWEIANVDQSKTVAPVVLGQLDQFYKAVKAGDFNQLRRLIDLDYWARFDAYRELLAIDHDTSGANFIMFYEPQKQWFYPVARSEGDLGKLAISGGNTLRSFNNYDPHLAAQFDYQRLFILLNLQPEFRLLKYQYLNQLDNQAGALNADFDLIYVQYASVMLGDTSDEASAWEKKKLFRNYRQTIEANLKIIHQELTFAQVAINVVNHGRQAELEIIPDALVPIVFDRLVLKLTDGSNLDVTAGVKDQLILAAINPALNVIPTTYAFSFSVRQPVVSISVTAKNQITQTPIESVFTAVASN